MNEKKKGGRGNPRCKKATSTVPEKNPRSAQNGRDPDGERHFVDIQKKRGHPCKGGGPVAGVEEIDRVHGNVKKRKRGGKGGGVPYCTVWTRRGDVCQVQKRTQ